MFGSFSNLQTHKSSKSSTGMFVRPIHLIAPLPGARLSCFPYLQSSVPDPWGWILQAEQAQCSERGPGSSASQLPSPRAAFHLCLVCHTFSFGWHFIWGICHQPLTWLGFCTSLLCSSSLFFQMHTAGMDHRPSLVYVLWKVILNDTDALKARALGDFEAFGN